MYLISFLHILYWFINYLLYLNCVHKKYVHYNKHQNNAGTKFCQFSHSSKTNKQTNKNKNEIYRLMIDCKVFLWEHCVKTTVPLCTSLVICHPNMSLFLYLKPFCALTVVLWVENKVRKPVRMCWKMKDKSLKRIHARFPTFFK